MLKEALKNSGTEVDNALGHLLNLIEMPTHLNHWDFNNAEGHGSLYSHSVGLLT